MTGINTFLLVVCGLSAGVAICGIYRRYPEKRTVRALVGLACVSLLGAALLATFMPRPDCYQPAHVQAVWLDGAWQCITPEEAG